MVDDNVYFEGHVQAKIFIEVEKIDLKVIKYQRVIFQNPSCTHFMKTSDAPQICEKGTGTLR